MAPARGERPVPRLLPAVDAETRVRCEGQQLHFARGVPVWRASRPSPLLDAIARARNPGSRDRGPKGPA